MKMDPRRAQELYDHEGTKAMLANSIDEMFWDNPIAYYQLCRFFKSSRFKIEKPVEGYLIEEGFLYEDGSLPATTNEVLYEAIYGEKPFWLN